jgi:hypothetical protein
MHLIWEKPSLTSASAILDPKILLRIFKELGDNSYPISGLLLIGMILGIRALLRHKQPHSIIWLLSWFVIPIPVLLFIEIWAGYFFAIRHILHITPPLLLFAGYGLYSASNRFSILPIPPNRIGTPAIVFAGLLVLGSLWIGQVHSRYEHADWRGASAFLSNTVREGDAVSMPEVFALLEYYDPGLEKYRVEDLDPDLSFLDSQNGINRRIVFCYENLWPDPCGEFRPAAIHNSAWEKYHFNGFTVFLAGR